MSISYTNGVYTCTDIIWVEDIDAMSKTVTLIKPIKVGVTSEVRIVTEFGLPLPGRSISIGFPDTSFTGCFKYLGHILPDYDMMVLRFHGAGILFQTDSDLPFCFVGYHE